MTTNHIIMHAQDLNDLLDITQNLQQHRRLMQRLGRAVHTATLMNFKRGVDPAGTPWLPLKSRQGQPLRHTGRLMRSITWEATDTNATVGTNVQYAKWHNFGVPKTGLPPRTFLGIAKPQIDLINRITDKWLQEVLNGNAA